jgi:hypothetical protein
MIDIPHAIRAMQQANQAQELNQLKMMQARQAFPIQQQLQQLKLQQAQQSLPMQQQLQQLKLQQAQQQLAMGEQEQQAQQAQAQRSRAVMLGNLAEQALNIEDEDVRNTFILGAAQKAGVPLDDPSQVTDDDLQQMVAARNAMQPGARDSKFGRAFQAVDDQGNLVWAQVDDKGRKRVIEGLRPLDIQQQRLDLRREIATGKAEREEKKFEAKEKEVRETKQADMNALTNTLSQVDAIINDPDFSGAVGLIDQFTARAGAAFGTKAGVVNRRAGRLLNTSIVKIAKSLGANPTDRDMVILKNTQPDLSDQPKVWQDWYENELIPAVNARLSAAGQDEIRPISPDQSEVRRRRYNPQTRQFE